MPTENPSRLRRYRIPLAALVGALAIVAGASAYSTVSAQSSGDPQGFLAVTPTRVFDTRVPIGAGVTKAPLQAGTTTTFDITDVTGSPVPANASAVVLNVTVSGGTSTEGWIALHPAGAPPTIPVSNVNYLAGQTVANQVTVGLDAGGQFSILNPTGTGPVDVFIDVFAFYTDFTVA